MGTSRAFQAQKDIRYNEARKNGKELVRDGMAFLYRNLSSWQYFLLKLNQRRRTKEIN